MNPKFWNLVNRFQKVHFSSPWTAPSLVFLACFFSFGVLLSNLGYFQDDWHHVYYGFHEGLDGLQRFFFTDSRPLAYGLYGFLFQVLGFSPSHWHWLLMLLRFLTALGFWLVARQLWPGETELTAWLAVFFALHPVFTLQSLSAAYTLHWVSYLAVVFSFVVMLLSLRSGGKSYWLFSGLALVLQTYHLLIMEYFSGLELVRILILWLALADFPLRERVKKTLWRWLPYLGILILYAGYRLSYSFLFGYDRFKPILLIGLINAPFNAIVNLLQSIVQDSIYILFSPWYTAIMPAVFDLGRPSTWYMLGSSLAFAILFFFITSRMNGPQSHQGKFDRYAWQLLVFGFLATLLGMLPSWLVGFSMYEKNPLWSSRLALPAMLGASMVTVGVVALFVQRPARRTFILSVLLAIAIGAHIQTAREFKSSWDKQRQFYWQLWWRAPALEPGTLIVADGEILPFMGDSPTGYAINLLFPATAPRPMVDYWFNPGSANLEFDSFSRGQPADLSKYSTPFTARIDHVLALTFEPGQGQCLWLLRPAYREVRFLTGEAYRWMAYSNLSLVQPYQAHQPPADIFGSEPAHTWCYYYQKADLAAQFQDWPQVITLWQTAQANSYRPAASVELLPFIEAYARTAEWEQARMLTFQANALEPRMPSLLCSQWQSFEKDGLLSPENESMFMDVKNRVKCQE